MKERQAVCIKLADDKMLHIEGVTEYGYNERTNSYYVIKDGFRQFFNKDYVAYIGNASELSIG